MTDKSSLILLLVSASFWAINGISSLVNRQITFDFKRSFTFIFRREAAFIFGVSAVLGGGIVVATVIYTLFGDLSSNWGDTATIIIGLAFAFAILGFLAAVFINIASNFDNNHR